MKCQVRDGGSTRCFRWQTREVVQNFSCMMLQVSVKLAVIPVVTADLFLRGNVLLEQIRDSIFVPREQIRSAHTSPFIITLSLTYSDDLPCLL